VFCREHALQLQRDRDEFEAAGVRLAVIGQGTPEQAAEFLRSQKLDLPLLADEKREAYKAVGTKIATFRELLGLKVTLSGIVRGVRAGVHQGRTVGHPAQLGGVVMIEPDGSIPYAHLSKDASDVAPNDEVLDAARTAAAA
jgi:hypothetical protein